MTWEQLARQFSASIQGSYAQTLKRYGDAIAAQPEAFRARVEGFFSALAQSRANLERIQARLPNPPKTQPEAATIARYAEMRALYDALVMGVSQGSAPAKTEVGWGPAAVVLLVGAVGLTVAGVAWAVCGYEYAVGLRDQTAFLDHELAARVEAMRGGTTLQPQTSTPPSAENPLAKKEGGGGVWLWAVAGLGLAGAAFLLVPKLGKG